jgi:hypothetical protein
MTNRMENSKLMYMLPTVTTEEEEEEAIPKFFKAGAQRDSEVPIAREW